MLNPEKIWHEDLTDLSTSRVRCSHFTLVNPKSHFSSILFIYFRLFTLPQKKINSKCCAAALAVYLLLFSPFYYLHALVLCLGYATRGAHVLIWTCWGLRHGLNFSTAWCTVRLISAEKDWKHVLMQKVVTMNTCCDIACLTFQLPHITTGSFQSHRRQPTTGCFQSLQCLKERTQTFSSDEKVLQFTS